MLTISELHIYPVKSLAGISVQSALLTDRGFQYDRRWILVDAANNFLTQREIPSMALVKVEIGDGNLIFRPRQFPASSLVVPLQAESAKPEMIQIWNDRCEAVHVSNTADEWFTDLFSFPCRLMYMPDYSKRWIDKKYGPGNEVTNLSDALPILIIGQSSLDDLNARMESPVPMNRFRPNIVFTNGMPFEEDEMEHVQIGSIDFFGVKLCGRCNITTIDQETTAAGKEPLKTLSTYRRKNNNVYFGQYLLYNGNGVVTRGDVIEFVKRMPSALRGEAAAMI